jgi:hypothetical protein
MTLGLEVLVQDVIAVFQVISLAVVFILGFATDLSLVANRDTTAAFAFQPTFIDLGRLDLQTEEIAERLGDIRQCYAILRALGAGKAGFDRAHVQLQAVGEHRFLTRQTP